MENDTNASPANNDEPVVEKVKFKGASGKEFEVDATLYNDISQKHSGEKRALQAKYEKDTEELKLKFAETEKQLNEIRRASMSDKERLEAERADREQALMDAQSTAQKNYQMYQDYRIKSDIERVINKYSDRLVAPQFMGLIVEQTLKPALKDDRIVVGDGDFEQAFVEFLGREESKSLLKNTLPPGSGTSQGKQAPQNTRREYKRSEMQSNPELQKEYNKRLMNREDVKIIE